MKRKTPLKATGSLKAKTSLKKTPLSKTPKQPISKLKKDTWDWFSRYVRIRDSEYKDIGELHGWFGKCITCSKYGLVAYIDEKDKLRFTKGWDAGHFVPRGSWIVRFDEENVNLQCSFACNKMKSGNREKYFAALQDKYGKKVPTKLEELARGNPTYNMKREELEQIRRDAKTQIDFYTNMLK